jgi:EpsI family protein
MSHAAELRLPFARALVLLLVMVIALGLSVVLRPTARMAMAAPPIDLETAIPSEFANWRIDPGMVPVSVAADVQSKLDAIYDQLLSRTYVNDKGQRIMLSIAYGGDQSSDKSQVHRPEYCYKAQGFQLSDVFESRLNTKQGELPVRKLLARQGARNEPITYWITIGDQVTLPGLGRKVAQLSYGLTGKVPDGMLVRVSSIDDNNSRAYELQEHFVTDMLAAIDEAHRVRVAGHLTRN